MNCPSLTRCPTTTDRKTTAERRKIAFFFRAWLLLMVASLAAYGQQTDPFFPEVIAVAARPWGDSIALRWAPKNYRAWRTGIRHGYTIERYRLSRHGQLLSSPERTVLQEGLKPLPEMRWEPLVHENKFAAIAAQALYGDRFEVDLARSDIFSIVNKAQENEQRYSFALFACDMSPVVARASGLYFTDRQVVPGDRYLYRIVVTATDSLRGSVLLGPDDAYSLPRPEGLRAEFSEATVSLRWEMNGDGVYTAWKIERSLNGRDFVPVSDIPLVTLASTTSEDTRYNYAVDSLANAAKVYHYRVRGITPFGEESGASEAVSGGAIHHVSGPPYISAAHSNDNATIVVEWEFPSGDNDAISGFLLERSSRPRGAFSTVSSSLSPAQRNFTDTRPEPVNYYRVTAVGLDGNMLSSPLYLAQLIDSLPPAAPTTVKAIVNDQGIIALSWAGNAEPDLYGYRVFRSNLQSEEPAQVTVAPVGEAHYQDSVDLSTLNEFVYYRVMAVDRSQNLSPLSEPLTVPLPDKVPPQPPVPLPAHARPDAITVSWIPSASDDVVQYAVYRKEAVSQEWRRITVIKNTGDSIYHHRDTAANSYATCFYTIVAIDDAGLESAPCAPLAAVRPGDPAPPIRWRKPVLLRAENRLTLRWQYAEEAESFRLYAHNEDKRWTLYKTLTGEVREYADVIVPGRHYAYRILAVFENGRASAMSDALFFQY